MSISLPSVLGARHVAGEAARASSALRVSHQLPLGSEQGAQTLDPRLVIEQDKPTGTFVYKTVDRVTGDLLYQYPDEGMLRLRDDPGYVSGAVVSKSA